MADGLIGHTGFVGGSLSRQRAFDACFHSRNIEEIRYQHFDLLVCSGLPAAKWIANREPEADLANMTRLLECLHTVRAERMVLISTVDVYPVPVGVNEDSPIDPEQQQPYGRHRLMMEFAVRDLFDSVLVVRLPGLFGLGLKKNAIYDFLHDNDTHKIHCEAMYQFYYLDHLWPDIERATRLGVPLINFATEPVSIAEMTRDAFGFECENRPAFTPPCYDMRTKHAEALGGAGGYVYDRKQVMADLRAFVLEERRAR